MTHSGTNAYGWEYTYTRVIDGTETVGTAHILVTGSDLAGNTTTASDIGTFTTYSPPVTAPTPANTWTFASDGTDSIGGVTLTGTGVTYDSGNTQGSPTGYCAILNGNGGSGFVSGSMGLVQSQTFGGLFKVLGYTSSGGGTDQQLVSYGEAGAGDRGAELWTSSWSGQHHVYAMVKRPNIDNSDSTAYTMDYADGNWHLFTFVRDTTASTVKLYVDGALVETISGASNATLTAGKIEFGINGAVGTENLHGCIADGFFDTNVWTDSQVSAYRNTYTY